MSRSDHLFQLPTNNHQLFYNCSFRFKMPKTNTMTSPARTALKGDTVLDTLDATAKVPRYAGFLSSELESLQIIEEGFLFSFEDFMIKKTSTN